MNIQTNLAFALVDTETEIPEGPELTAVELDSLLRLSSRRADAGVRPRTSRRQRILFQDNHSDTFRPFRVY